MFGCLMNVPPLGIADINGHCKIRPHIKGRVNVNQLQAPLRFDFSTQRTVLQSG